jgi:cysteine desulfuration protein SufE
MNQEIKQILEEFEILSDWQDKYSYIIDLGKQLSPLPESEKTEANKVSGCVSQVWIISTIKDGQYYFTADSDAFIVKGLLAIVLRIFSGKTREEILSTDFQALFNKLGFANHLSPSRSNGLFAVVKRIIAFTDSESI